MAFTSLHTFDDSDVNMRFRMLYVTEGLNKKDSVNNPHGVYRGLKLASNATDNWLTIEADPDEYDHYAVYLTSSGHSVSIHNREGSYNIDLTPLVEGFSKDMEIALYAQYSLGMVTRAEIRAYELTPTDEFTGASEKGELIILGRVTVPAGGGIITNISNSGRTSAWRNKAPDHVVWPGVIKNGKFEVSDEGNSAAYAVDHWYKDYVAGTITVASDNGDAYVGQQSLLVNWAAAASTVHVTQYLNVPCSPGQLLRLSARKKQIALSTAGTVSLEVTYNDSDNALLVATQEVLTNEVDAGWVLADYMLEVPSGAYYVSKISVRVDAVTLAGAGDFLRLDDIQLWMEPLNYNVAAFADRIASTSVIDAFVGQPGTLAASRLTATGNVLTVEGKSTGDGGSMEFDGPVEIKQDTTLGADSTGSAADASQARMTLPVNTGGNLTCLRESISGGKGARVYADSNGRLSFTSNAVWDGANWAKDQNGQTAVEVRVENGKVTSYFMIAGTNSWVDGNWNTHYVIASTDGPSTLDLSNNLLASDADNIVPRLATERGTSKRTLMYQTDGDPEINARFYLLDEEESGSLDAFEIVVNAAWDNATGLWDKDTAAKSNWAYRLVLSTRDFILEGRNTTVSTWDDTGWSRRLNYTLNLAGDLNVGFLDTASDVFAGGSIIVPDVVQAGDQVVAGANDTTDGYFSTQVNFDSAYDGGDGLSSTNINGRLYKNNMVKAWATIWSYNGSLFLLDGFGIQAISLPDAQTIRVTPCEVYPTRTINGQNTKGYSVLVRSSSVTVAGDPDAALASGHNYFTHVVTRHTQNIDIQRRGTTGTLFSWTGQYRLVRLVIMGAIV